MNGVIQPSLWSCSNVSAVFHLLRLWMAVLKGVRESPHSSLVGCVHDVFMRLQWQVSLFFPQFDIVLSRMGERVLFVEKLSFHLSGYTSLNRFQIGVSASGVKGALFCHYCDVGWEPVCRGLSGCPSWGWLTFTCLPGTLVFPKFPSFFIFAFLFVLFCFEIGKSRTLSSKSTEVPTSHHLCTLGRICKPVLSSAVKWILISSVNSVNIWGYSNLTHTTQSFMCWFSIIVS